MNRIKEDGEKGDGIVEQNLNREYVHWRKLEQTTYLDIGEQEGPGRNNRPATGWAIEEGAKRGVGHIHNPPKNFLLKKYMRKIYNIKTVAIQYTRR